jgi:D-aminopeptidase
VVSVASRSYTVGALVLANFGRLPMLTIDGAPLGRVLAERAAKAAKAATAPATKPEQGSIIMIVATDAPLDARQLKRLSLRAAAGLARTGSVYGHGSGDIALAFSTAYTVPYGADFIALPPLVADERLDPLFRACADSVEQAILDALWSAASVTGRDGHRRLSLRDSVPDLAQLLKPTP